MLVAAFSARPAEAAPFAYVANFIGNTVSVIDTATNTVVATVPVGGPQRGSRHPGRESRLCDEC
jgi:YVTN family beta-propeller protein